MGVDMKYPVLSILCAILVAGDPLKERLHHYDTLSASDISHHHVQRRSVGETSRKEKMIEFKTLGREFKLRMHPERELFSQDFQVTTVKADNESSYYSLAREEFLSGYIDGMKYNSKVFAYYEKENLVATIKTPEDTYHVEPSWRHFSGEKEFTMVAYRASDIKNDTERDPKHHMGSSFCGYVHADTGVDDAAYKERPPMEHKDHSRNRRQTDTHNTCRVVMVADYHFFQEVGGSNVGDTARYMVGVLSRVNDIYENTAFGGSYIGLGFEVSEIIVHQEPTSTTGTHYNMEATSWNTQDLLNAFSFNSQWKDYCLAHLFTHLAFSDGVLGLGWIAEASKSSAGGICSPSISGYYYNTAWTSASNKYGNRLLTQEADLVTAHEFGHNWGSPHDPDTSECAPSSNDGGSYLMYTYSVAGYDTNNYEFSPCSKRSILDVLEVKAKSCFTERSTSFCGNYQIEDEEECDAGPASRSGTDPCCDTDCTFKSGAVCSDANSACCSGCQYAPATTLCRDTANLTTSCEANAYCTGSGPDCPPSGNKPDNTPCIDNGKCQGGVCKTLCESIGKISCFCDELDDACSYCCRGNRSDVCTPYTDPTSGQMTQLPDGRTCIQGSCSAGVCEKEIRSATSRLWDIIKGGGVSAILKFMKDNLVIVCVLLSLVLYVPCCLIIWCIDRKRDKDDKEQVRWNHKDNTELVAGGDKRRIRQTYTKQRPRRMSPNGEADSMASASKVKFNPRPM